jgi:uncharacterized protein YlaI
LEVRCALCGKREVITDVHKDFDRLEKDPKVTYFCEMCLSKLQFQLPAYLVNWRYTEVTTLILGYLIATCFYKQNVTT